jgi:cytochrome c
MLQPSPAGITGTNRCDRAFNRQEHLCPAPQSWDWSAPHSCFWVSRPSPQEPAAKGTDAGSGQQTFNNACRTCHTTKEGDNRLGPNLHNIIGRKAGSLQNYGYSSAMKGADFVWDKEKLDRFIAKPDEVVPGNNMKPYGGLTSAEDRAKVIVFLESPTAN